MAKQRINAARRAQIGEERRAKTRETVLGAAFAQLGHERGRLGSVEEICALAGISRASFYNYFTDLEQLLEALTYELSHEFNLAMLATIQSITGYAERTAAAVRFHIRRAGEDPRWGWAIIHISSGGPILGAESYRRCTQTIKEGLETGELKECSLAVAVDIILGTTLAAMMRVLQHGQPLGFPEDVARHILLSLGVQPEQAARCVASELPDPFAVWRAMRSEISSATCGAAAA